MERDPDSPAVRSAHPPLPRLLAEGPRRVDGARLAPPPLSARGVKARQSSGLPGALSLVTLSDDAQQFEAVGCSLRGSRSQMAAFAPGSQMAGIKARAQPR